MTLVRGSYGDTAGSTATANVSITLPTGIVSGDISWLVISTNSSVATLNPPTGWENTAGPVDNSNVCRSWLFRKVMDGSESGTVVTATFSQSGRWTGAGLVIGDTTGQDSLTFAQDTTTDLTASLPPFTPVADDCLAVGFVGAQHPSGQPSGFSPPAGWTELEDRSTSFGSGANLSAVVVSKQLTGQAGTAQPSVDGTWVGNTRNNQWVVTFAPQVTVVRTTTGTATGTGQTSATTATTRTDTTASALIAGPEAPDNPAGTIVLPLGRHPAVSGREP